MVTLTNVDQTKILETSGALIRAAEGFGILCNADKVASVVICAVLRDTLKEHVECRPAFEQYNERFFPEGSSMVTISSQTYASAHEAAFIVTERLFERISRRAPSWADCYYYRGSCLSEFPKELLDDPAVSRQLAECVAQFFVETFAESSASKLSALVKRERTGIVSWIDSEARSHGGDDDYLPAETPSECATRMGHSLDWVKDRIKDGQLRHKPVTGRSWRLHRGDVQNLGGRLD